MSLERCYIMPPDDTVPARSHVEGAPAKKLLLAGLPCPLCLLRLLPPQPWKQGLEFCNTCYAVSSNNASAHNLALRPFA